MGYVIIDLEFNNMQNITKYYPNIYKENKELRDSKVDNEIIEIGAVKLNKFMQKIDEYRVFIKPSVFKIINPKIVQITGITQEQLEKGISFQKAMNQLKNFFDDGDILCSWATDDIVQIIENAKYHGYEDINWIKEYLDIQEYCTKMLAHKKSLSLKNALEELKIKVDKGSLHDALNDASYTAEVFKRLYNNRVVKGYIVKDVYSMPSSRVKDLKNYNADSIKVGFVCPKCKINVNIEHPLKLFSWRFISIGKCPKCKSNILQEVILKKTLSGDIVYNNINTFISNMEYIDYVYKFKRLESR